MAEFNSAYNGIAVGGLTTGIIGTALSVANGGLGNLLGGSLTGGNAASMAQTAMQFGDHYATKQDLEYSQ